MNLDYSTWQEPLAAAILEFKSQLPEKLRRAEGAIAKGFQELRFAETKNQRFWPAG